MLEKSDYHEDEPSNQNDWKYEDSDNNNNQDWRCKRIDDEAEIEINNLKTSFFLKCREFIFLEKIIEGDEDEPERTPWEEISREVQYTEHFYSFLSWRIRWFLDWSWCYFWYYLFDDLSSYFFDRRLFLWCCFLCHRCCLLRNSFRFLCHDCLWSCLTWRCDWCFFRSRFLWSLFGSTLFWSGICFYHRWNTKQTLSEVKKIREKIPHFVLWILYFVL